MKHALTILLIVLPLAGLRAQITISEQDYSASSLIPSTLHGYHGTNSNLETLVNQMGANQTWNFDSIGNNTSGYTVPANPEPYPSGVPDANDFPGSTVVRVGSVKPIHYTFFKMDSTGWWILGQSEDSSGTPIALYKYSPPLRQWAFPLTYQTAWSSTSIDTVYDPPKTETITREGLVDGWGTLVTPAGSNSVLRVRVSVIDSQAGSKITTTSFFWYTETGFLAAEILLDSNQKVQSGYCYVPNLAAPISISEQDFFASLLIPSTEYDYIGTASSLQPLVNGEGAGQTWNFSNRGNWDSLGGRTEPLISEPYPSGAADADSFAAATVVMKDSVGSAAILYEFFKTDSTDIWLLGLSGDSSGTPIEMGKYSPPLQLDAFPLTYLTSWSNSSSATGMRYDSTDTETITVEGLVDGWGTLVTPSGSSFVLRVHMSQIVSHSTSNTTTNNQWYEWYTKTGFLAARINVDSNQVAQSGYYFVPYAPQSFVPMEAVSSDELSLSVSQNPVSTTQSELYYTLKEDGPVQIMLVDQLGRNVHMLFNGFGYAGVNHVPIDPSSLTNGSYFIRATANGQSAMVKLLIAK